MSVASPELERDMAATNSPLHILYAFYTYHSNVTPLHLSVKTMIQKCGQVSPPLTVIYQCQFSSTYHSGRITSRLHFMFCCVHTLTTSDRPKFCQKALQNVTMAHVQVQGSKNRYVPTPVLKWVWDLNTFGALLQEVN